MNTQVSTQPTNTHEETDVSHVRLWHDWVFVLKLLRTRELKADAATVCEVFLDDLISTADIAPGEICDDCMSEAHRTSQLPQLLVKLTK